MVCEEKEKTQALILEKRVINESDLRRGFDQRYNRIVIPPKALITPLAQDYINTKNLQVERIES